MMKFVLSRLWNKVVFFLLRLIVNMIWDQTGRNKDLIDYMKDPIMDGCNEILTSLPEGFKIRRSYHDIR